MQTERAKKMVATKAARLASMARIAAAHKEAQTAVSSNRCPQCGNGVHQNSALTGWVQCNGFGAKGFRQKGHENDKSCSWQGFTA